MFKALVLKKQDEADASVSVEDLNISDLPEGDVLVKVSFSTINYKDALAITSSSPIIKNYPMVPGIDFAGEVEESNNNSFKTGDKVILNGFGVGEKYWGGLAQKARVKGEWLVKLPEKLTEKQAMAIGTAGYTAMLCVLALEKQGVTPDKGEILVTGATGGVGITAIEISKAVGAKVIATASTDEKLKIAKEYGADYCINYSQNEFKDKVKEYTDGKGANIIYDPVGGDVFNQSLRCIAWNGIILVIGFASGTIASAPTNLPLLKNCSIVGVFWGAWREREPNGHNINMEKILKWWKENKVKPKVSKVFNLEDTKYALQALINREVIGKAVIKVR